MSVRKSSKITASARNDRNPVIFREGIVKSKKWQNRRHNQKRIPREKHHIGTSGNSRSVDIKMQIANPK